MKIHLHVGVHKTATTFIQDRLKNNLTKLNQAGIGFMPHGRFRASFQEKVSQIDPASFRLEDHLAGYFQNGVPAKVRGIVMSDENLIGLCGKLVNTGVLYDGVMARMAQLSKLLAGHEVTLFCAVRSYDAFIVSAYCEALRSKPDFCGFKEFESRLKWERMDWPLLLGNLESALKPAGVRYWRYEQFRPNAEAVMKELAFGQALDGSQDDTRPAINPSFSQLAVDALESIADRLGPTVAGALVRPVTDALSKTKGYAEFDPWDDKTKLRLAARYEEDCRKIAPEKWLLPLAPKTAPQVASRVASQAGAPASAHADVA